MQTSAINKQSGFSLLEILIVITILGIAISLVSLTLPRPIEQEWQQDMQSLTSTLNQAREEAAVSGAPVKWMASSEGWRFKQVNTSGEEMDLPQPLEPKTWRKQPVNSKITTLIIGKEVFTPPLLLEFSRDHLTAKIQRNETGRFQLVSP